MSEARGLRWPKLFAVEECFKVREIKVRYSERSEKYSPRPNSSLLSEVINQREENVEEPQFVILHVVQRDKLAVFRVISRLCLQPLRMTNSNFGLQAIS